MADLTGKVSSSSRVVSSGSRYITLEFSQTRLIPSNQSEISWTLKGAGTASGYVMTGPITAYIDGVRVYYSADRIELRSGTLIKSGKLTVNHNSDGSKQLPISLSAAIYEKTVNVNGSQTFTLVSNPRASTITASNTEIGKNCIINISKVVNSYTSTLSYKLYKDDKSSTILKSGSIDEPKTSKTSVSWEVPVDFYTALWNTPRGYCVISCDTYDGNSKIGNTTSTGIWVTMGESVNPQISECVAINNDTTTSGITGSDGYIIGQSLISVKCSAVMNKSAQLSSITVTNGTNVYNLTDGVISQISNPSSSDFVFKVTDSRGLSTEQIVRLTPYNYVTPSIVIEQIKMELNPEDETKGQITLSLRGNGYDGKIGSITNSTTIEFTVTDEESEQSRVIQNTEPLNWSLYIEDSDAYAFYEVHDIILPVDNPDATYKIVATIKDLITTAGVNSTEVLTNRVPVYDYNKENFNFNVPIYYKDAPFINMGDASGVIYFGNNGLSTASYAWKYRILQNEWVEMWGKVDVGNVGVNTAVGNMWAMDAVKIPTPINIEVDSYDVPYTITAQISDMSIDAINYPITHITTSYAWVGHEINESDWSQSPEQYAVVSGISPTRHYATTTDEGLYAYIYIHISGHTELPKPDFDYDEGI